MEKQTLILTASAFIIGFAISAALFLAADSAETKGLSFNQTNLGLRYDMSSPRDQSVFLVFHGESYEEVFTLDQISEPSTKDESSAFVKAITRANTSASLVEFSQLWAPAEREAAILRGRTDNRFESLSSQS